jgi:Icc-related predicted phosphoesterase
LKKRILITSDLHQDIGKWNDLAHTVERVQPRFVLVAGDLLPRGGGFRGQQEFFPVLAGHLARMRGRGGTTVLMLFGNDDFHPLEALLDDLAARGLCVNVGGRVHREDGLVFCGMSHVRDYPFRYKHWCAPDGDFVVCPEQFAGEGLTVDAEGRWVPVANLREHLLAKPGLRERLEALHAQLAPDEVPRSVWLVHNPPARLGMDLCHGGRAVGSAAMLHFIEKTQPLLGCSGHIHESPYQPGGQWAARVGRTTWIQPGQEGAALHCVSLDLEDGRVSGCRHSVLGAAAGL